MIFLYVFLGLILLLLAFLCCPMFVHVSFQDFLRLKIKFLFFSFEVFPQKEPENNEKDVAAEPKSNKSEYSLVNSKFFSIIKEKGFFGFLRLLKQVAEILLDSAKKVLKKVHISSFDLYLLVASESAAQTAVNYGKVTALVGSVEAVLLRNVNQGNYHIEVISGFNETESKVDFSSKIYFFPISMLGIALNALYKFAKNTYVSVKSGRV